MAVDRSSLIGGGVELGESHRAAIVREVDEELGAGVHDLVWLATVESIFRIDGALGHEIVFLYSGRLDPLPATEDASLTEIDGTVVPAAWRSVREAAESASVSIRRQPLPPTWRAPRPPSADCSGHPRM